MTQPDQEWIDIARIMKPVGLHGDLKVEPQTHDPDRHQSLQNVRLQLRNGEIRHVHIQKSRRKDPLWIFKLEGVDTPEQGKEYSSAQVQIPLAERLPAPEGCFYASDLEGFQVQDESGKIRGTFLDLIEAPSVDVLHLRIDGIPVLAPWIDDCIGEIDTQRKIIPVKIAYLKDVYPKLMDSAS